MIHFSKPLTSRTRTIRGVYGAGTRSVDIILTSTRGPGPFGGSWAFECVGPNGLRAQSLHRYFTAELAQAPAIVLARALLEASEPAEP